MYIEIARKNKHFKKRKHVMSDDAMYMYGDDDEQVENLMQKTDITEVTNERFAAWLSSFRAEAKIKLDRDATYQRRKLTLAKPSGRMIFSDRTKDFGIYFEDDKIDGEGEAIDLKKVMLAQQEQEMLDREDEVYIDEDIFEEDEDLDEDMLLEDD